MSEYQYYEFRTVDRALTKAEMAEIRRLSTRAEITPTSFTNEYHFGNFKGDPLEMMQRWYDAHVYTANWGSHQLMFAFPHRLLDPEVTQPYCDSDQLSLSTKGDRVVLSFDSSPEDGGLYDDDWENTWLDRLIPLRADLAQGDLRALYLGWLFGVQESLGYRFELDDDEMGDDYWAVTEPPLPAGLRDLTEPLQALVEFLRLDQDLLTVAAAPSPDFTESRPSTAELQRWLDSLPVAAKDAALLRVLADEGAGLRLDLLRRFRQATAGPAASVAAPRRAGDMIAAAQNQAAERKRQETERAAKEKERKERAAAAARSVYLDGLGARQEQIWTSVDTLIDAKTARSYADAIALLVDLRALSHHLRKVDVYEERVQRLRNRHAKKTAFLARLDEAGL